jgi:hypothetical protein
LTVDAGERRHGDLIFHGDLFKVPRWKLKASSYDFSESLWKRLQTCL